MRTDVVPWVFVVLLMAAGMFLAVSHSQSMTQCDADKAAYGK